jgi:basic amino acid/polyamine antiporter, APA family
MKDHRLGLFSGTGMVIANMIGAGVFMCTGFMVQQLTPTQILLAWVIGALLALAGARAYAGIAQIVPHSGGEYRYLSTLVHPSLGYFAGWASLLLGFSAPIAIDALAAGAFTNKLISARIQLFANPQNDISLYAALLIIALTAVHAVRLRFSVTTQNVLVIIKIALVVGFIVIGLALGNNSWPKWQPPNQ